MNEEWSDTVIFNYHFINVDADEEEKRENTVQHLLVTWEMCAERIKLYWKENWHGLAMY